MFSLGFRYLVYQALDKNVKAWDVALDISKAFNTVGPVGLLHKLKGHGVSGWIFDFIWSFLNCAMKFMLNDHSFGSFHINEVVSQGSIFRSTFSYLYQFSWCHLFPIWYIIVTDKVKLAADYENDLKSVVNWGKF